MTLHNATPKLAARIDWAIDRFSDAGLRLPSIEITFHEHLSGCEGYPGLFRRIGEVGYIDVCNHTRHLILHELAHAWDSLGSEIHTRPAFLDHWELSFWRGADVSWDERGAEKAADTIAFSLDGIPSDPTESLLRYLCGFELLTGKPLPSSESGQAAKWCPTASPS